MRTILSISSLAIAIALLPACTMPPTQEQTGMVIGGALGGVLGSQIGGGHGQTAAIIAGTMLGAGIGGNIGRSMDDVDRLKVGETLETVRTGVPASWHNPDTGNQYTVVPTRTIEAPSGQPCREYTINGVIGGRNEQVVGKACRQADGSWRSV
jgi:surface antigen